MSDTTQPTSDDAPEDGIEPLLQAYLDDELTPEERAQVDQTLEHDAEARQILEELIALSGELRGLLSAREQTGVEVRVPGLRVPATAAAAAPAPAAAAPAAKPADAEGATQEVARGYRVIRQLAKGGFGTVYLAQQLSMDRPVALKVMAPELAQNQEYVQRFLREARLAATLRHPNLVAIYDVQHNADQLYYSMEYIDGEDAEAQLKREGFLPQKRAAEIAAETASALIAVSAKGIVHRDIKPANLLLTTDQRVKVADLGLARGDEGPGNASLTMKRKVIGSPNYMSPEQAQDLRKATTQSDVYSLGATLLHLVTGAVPFGTGSAVEIIARVLRDEPQLPDMLPSGEKFDPALKDLVRECLAKDPAARPTPEALERRLRAYLAGAATGSTRRSTGRSARGGVAESGRRATARGTSRGRQRRASEPEGAAAIPAQRSWAPLAIGVAAALLAAIGLAMWLSGGDEPDPAVTQGVQVATDEGAETPQDEPPTPETPRRGPRRADPVEAPDAAPRELPEVAALERFWEQNPSDAGEAYRRAEAVLALYPGDAAATERAVAVRDASAQALDDELNSLRGRSDSYAQRGELWEARTQYLEFMNRHGADNPASSAAERALSALDVQIAVQLEQDLERLDGLLAEGKVEDAEALARAIRQNAGPEGHAQAVAKLDAQPNAGGQPADGEPAVAVKDPAETPKDPAETPKQPDAQPTPDAEAALAKRKQEASELLAAAQGKLDAGDADGAEELLTKLRKDYADVDDTKQGADELAAAIVTARQPKEPEVFAAFFHAQSVEVQDEGKLVLTYTFESELEAKDWVDDALRRGGRSRVVSRVLEAAGPQVKGAEPWEVRKKALLGFGWSRREHVATFRRDQELTLEVEANGKRNVVVGFNKNETKTDLVAFNFQLDDMPIGPLEKEMLAEKIGDRDGFLRRLFKRVEESQEAGFEVAVFTEQGILGGFDKQFGQRIRPKSKLGFSATLAPHDFGGEEAEGEDAPTHEHALTLKIGRRVGSPIPMEGGPWAKPVLAAFGYPVTFTQIVVKGSLTETFRNRILELAKKGPLETLRQRYDAEEQEKDEKKAKEQAAEDRKRRGGK